MNLRIHKHYQHLPAKLSRQDRKTIQVLQDLIRINKDRIRGYEKAAHEDNKWNSGIRSILYRMSTESRAYVNELHAEVVRLGGSPVTQETISGNIYFFWLNLKVDFGCGAGTSGAYGEEAMQKAYERTLNTNDDLPRNIFHLVEKQLWALQYNYPKGPTFVLNHQP